MGPGAGNAANVRNLARSGAGERLPRYSIDDLIAAWIESSGRCAVSGLRFDLQEVGDGQAKRPFAPSLDGIDRHGPYRRDNVRLLLSIANFAMNAWGLPPLLRLATALHQRHGDVSVPARRGPSDADLDDIATVDSVLVQTDVGTVAFLPRPDLHQPILDLLRSGCKSSREIEDYLAKRFGITDATRTTLLRSGCPAWRNHVAWALGDLVEHKRGNRGMGKIKRVKGKSDGDGGWMGVYCLMSETKRQDD